MSNNLNRQKFHELSDQAKLEELFKNYLPDLHKRCDNLDKINNKLILNDNLEEYLNKELAAFQDGNSRVFLSSISGLSGVGKSFLEHKLKEQTKNDYKILEIATDSFIGSERDSNARASMPENWDHFKHLFYDEGSLKSFLKKIINGEPNETITQEKVYNHDTGKFDGTVSITVPNEKFVLFLEGVNATEYVKDTVKDSENVHTVNFTVLDDPAESIMRACLRDVIVNENIDLKKILIARIKEYSHMWRWMFKNIQDCDKVIFNNNAFVAVPEQLKHFIHTSEKTYDDILKIVNIALEEFSSQKLQDSSLKSEIVKKFCETLMKRINNNIHQSWSKS